MRSYLLAFAIGLILSWVLTPYVKKLAFRLGAVDKPNARKVHHTIMARLGGLAIYLGFMAGAITCMQLTKDVVGILVGGTIITLVGIADDIFQLTAKAKLLGQIVAALVLVGFGVRIEWLNNPFGGYFYLDYLSIPFTVFWVVSFTNVVNLMDGLDGLAAGVSAIASVTIILVALQQGLYPVAVITAALAGATLGFVRYNFNPATIFMGDTGSLFLGYMLAAISIYGAVKSAATIALIVPAIALGLPIMDTAFAIARRYLNGKPIFQPDKGHIHHRLLAMGFSQRQAVIFMYLISAGLCLSAVLLTEMEGIYAVILLIVILVAIFIGAKKIGILKER
ncbi:MAG: undecaprenyl/decaprenyl-phosphate alpha-N-acetylglucosaminyl 1-phosphate transferase [Acidaminococcaceae bacterium]|nr:undecaprenyl/decaprenyl-phosphate alpha-N-acetylglucosaminyl 1-phosphate transferase [Acidaminococcaceae bacterium]MCI2109636.1 undecaprenyl/decaprenyl-phosphate alpha-N-acetylglucosaminyl 1-phosphate transferase [Acidaminococcaceae bacterium]